MEKLYKMAFINFFIFLKKFEKVEKTGFFRAKFFFHCTLSLILGVDTCLLKQIYAQLDIILFIIGPTE
jgi:hypothetical protein